MVLEWKWKQRTELSKPAQPKDFIARGVMTYDAHWRHPYLYTFRRSRGCGRGGDVVGQSKEGIGDEELCERGV